MYYKLVRYGQTVEGTVLLHRNDEMPIEFLTDEDGKRGNAYVVKSTGEVREVRRGESRLSDVAQLRKTFALIRRLVIANSEHAERRARWITLTYKSSMRMADKKSSSDFKEFWSRFKRRYKDAETGADPSYICVAEPTAAGNIHFHVIALWPMRAPYVPNAEMRRECWGDRGFVKVTRVDSAVALAKYLSAYLTDMELPEDSEQYDKLVEVEGEDGAKVTKKIAKGARMSFYPKGFHIVRHSRDLVVPQEVYVTADEYARAVEGMDLVHKSEFDYEDEASGFVQHVWKEYYQESESPPKGERREEGS